MKQNVGNVGVASFKAGLSISERVNVLKLSHLHRKKPPVSSSLLSGPALLLSKVRETGSQIPALCNYNRKHNALNLQGGGGYARTAEHILSAKKNGIRV